MSPRRKWTSLGFTCLLLLMAFPARAQVSALGKGWLLDSAGSLTSIPAEVISGKNSIKGSSSGDPSIARPFLHTNPAFIHFTPGETYTISFSYRIITAGSATFAFGFFSSTAQGGGHFLPTALVTGATGASGTATLTSKLDSYTDVRAGFTVAGTGTIAIDDIRITNAGGQLLVSENAEGPTIVSGLLNFQLTDATALLTEAGATVRSAAARDLESDGYPETILTLTAPPPSTTPLQPIVIESSGRMRLATSDFFPTGAPTVKHSPVTLFADINNDGLQDILFAEAGYDGTPVQLPGSGIGVALNLGGGKYRNVSALVPADLQTTRSYALAVGDIDGDGRVEILLPDEDNGANTALLRWNGNGFDTQRNWIASSLWKAPTNLVHQDWMVLDDLDNDGRRDLILGAAPVPCTPTLRVLFGAAGGYTSAGLLQLPDGLFGLDHCATTFPVAQNVDVGPGVVADFNNDGLLDIFAPEEQVLTYQPGAITDTNEPDFAAIRANGGLVFADFGIQVLVNQGSRTFADVTSASSAQNLGRRHYSSFIPIDMNTDGFVDVVGLYQTKTYAGVKGGQWGTTVFLNDGTGAFQVVDGVQLLAAVTTTPSNGETWNLGAFIPTVVTPQRTEGIVYDSVGGCGLGFCAATGLSLYKVVANRAIGTGPGFQDSASLGVPGFNEFYYLRRYPDAAAAVQLGDYASGLAHYLAVGQSLGYATHAPRAAIDPIVTVSTTSMHFGATSTGGSFAAQTSGQTVRISQSGAGTFTWTATPSHPWIVVTPSSGTGAATLTVTVQSVPGLPIPGTSAGTIALSSTGTRNNVGPIFVTLTTKAHGTGAPPVGVLDTPADGAAGVTGSIAVTGWALDDTDVRQVRIVRDPVAGEAASPVFIGTAVLVEGSRPDVATLNPTAPRNLRAGWGYLLLTNFLPNQGNGTFTLYAYADDAEGQSALLGTKTIICTNSSATRPFGAIDTPAQGETISGATYNNFGWVLARGPARADPPHGTVQVVVDGVFGASPSLWTSRADLTSLFPAATYPGVTSALAVASLDTTTLADGVHTIAWVVTADNGQADGIGSRYFSVANGSSLETAPMAGMVRAARPLADEVNAARLNEAVVAGRRGYDLDAPFVLLTPDPTGRVTVQAEELDRIELQLGAGNLGGQGRDLTGYARAGAGIGPLPIGSRLDPATGQFTWQPGVGFVHGYDLVFVRSANGRAVSRQEVRVVLNPRGSNRLGSQIVIDTPRVQQDVPQPFTLAGWAIDPDDGIGTGIDTLHVWAYPLTGDAPIFIGAVGYGGNRPDVAAIFGDRFLSSGYGITVSDLPPGHYDLAVFAWSVAHARFLPARVVRVTVR